MNKSTNRDFERRDFLEHNLKSQYKILCKNIFGWNYCWRHLQIVGLLSSRHTMEFFITANTVRLLDYQQYNYRPVEYIQYLRRSQFIPVYVRNDIEFLWFAGNPRDIHTVVFRRISFLPVCIVYRSFNSLCNRSVYSVLLE